MFFELLRTLVEIGLAGWFVVEWRALKQQVNDMTEESALVRQDVADIKAKVAGMADAYTNAAAARLQKALDDQKAAIEAESKTDLDAAHADAQEIISALAGNQPITPPATDANPSPAPVASPAASDPAAAPTTSAAPAGAAS